jgi:2,4-dienoyl-CoA reductase (NADPH2)
MPDKQYPLLLSPFRIGPVSLKNRAVFSAHLTNMAENHLMSRKQAHYYEARAKGGCALIITEEVSVHPSDWAYEKLIDAFAKDVIPGYLYAADRVHRHGAKIFLQLNHNGSQGSAVYSRRPLWSPSLAVDPLFREAAKAMEEEEIEELIAYYTLAAVYGRKGGFDGIELQASHSSLLRQFLSPYSNKRRDEYGGSIANRFRLVERIGKAVRSAIGPAMALGIRYSIEEFIEGGLTPEDTLNIAELTEKCACFDYINFSTGIATSQLYLVEGTMAVAPAYSAAAAGKIRGAVNIPIIVAGRIKDPKQAEKILSRGQCDMVGMVRAQISDPFFMEKTAEGEEELINGCLSCNQDCIGRVGLNKEIGCVQNPLVGREEALLLYGLPPAKKPLKVVVAGGGPAGLKAAITAADRGLRVVLFEKEGFLGGRIPLAASLPYRAELGDSVRNLLNEMKRLENSIEIRLNTEADAAQVRREKPDAFIAATGAVSSEHYLRGGQKHVCDLTDYLRERPPLGLKVALIDLTGSFAAASAAELLLDMGREVEIFCGSLHAAAGLGRTTDLELWTKRVKEKGCLLTPNVSVTAINGKCLTVMNNYTGATEEKIFDSVLIAAPLNALNHLYYTLKDEIPSFLVGDALAPRNLGTAIYEGFEAALRIDA